MIANNDEKIATRSNSITYLYSINRESMASSVSASFVTKIL